MTKATYTAPAVLASIDAVEHLKDVGPGNTDASGEGIDLTPGSVGYSL